jgi:hypothetical protein
MSSTSGKPRRCRRLAVSGFGSLAVGVVLMHRRAGRPIDTRNHTTNWSPVERDEPNLREARRMQ